MPCMCTHHMGLWLSFGIAQIGGCQGPKMQRSQLIWSKSTMLWPKEPTSWSTSPMHSSVYIVFITESVELLMVRDYFGILYCKICGKMNKDHSQEYKWWMPKTKKSNIIMPPPRTTTSWPKIT